MASSSSTAKAPCATCGSKSAGIFRCEGCIQVFCRKHLNEHRDLLGHQLDEIVIQHDTLQQTIIENRDKSTKQHSVLKKIDKWERDSIMKIQKAASEAREQVNKLNSTQTKKLHDLAEILQKARVDDDYVETDLQTWTTMIEKLKDDVNTFSPSISLKEDQTKILVGKIHVLTQTVSHPKQMEEFGERAGNIIIENNGRSAVQCGPKSQSSYVRGICEYSSGKHCIRFLFKKKSSDFITSFEISSKLWSIQRLNSNENYGWSSQDDVHNGGVPMAIDGNFRDMIDETTFEIELELDCDNRRISYVNQRTRNRRKLDVDITKCPFPWQIGFYLYEVEDCVHLLP